MMKVFFRIAIVFFFATILLSNLSCKRQEKSSAPSEKITIAYANMQSSAIVQIAFAKGYFKEEGLDATPQPHAFGKLALHAVLDGKADIATAKDTPFMLAVMGGRKITTLAVIQTANMNQGIIARRDLGIAKPSDLKGKTIGVTRGTTSEFFADTFLTVHGIDREQVTIIDLKPDEMAAALGTGKLDAAASWNPNLTQLQKGLGTKGLIFYGETIYTEATLAISFQDFAKQHPEVIRKFLRALIKAENFLKYNPAESKPLVAKFYNDDKVNFEEIWDLNNFRVTLDQALIVNLENQTRWAMKHQLTARKDMPNYLGFIYFDGLQEVKPEAVRAIR